jgi:Sulfotransferase domain
MRAAAAKINPVLPPVLVRMLEGRVGSTAMMELLGSSPDIAFERVYPYEHSYLTYLVRLLRQATVRTKARWTMNDLLYGDLSTAGPFPFLPNALDLSSFSCNGLSALWEIVSDSIQDAAAQPPKLYAEKYWGQVVPVIEAGLCPMVIDLVRDPRDMVVSIRAFNEQRSLEMFGRSNAPDDTSHLQRMTIAMGFRLNEMAKALPVPRMTVRYEDLIADTPDVACRLSSFLGVQLDPRATRSRRAEVKRHVTSSSPAASVGRWQSELCPSDVALIERRLSKHMVKFGYELSTTS